MSHHSSFAHANFERRDGQNCLTPAQSERFWDLFHGLMLYASAQVDVNLFVDGEEGSGISEDWLFEVARSVWDNRQIIDDFVRLNPFAFDAHDLLAVSLWKNAVDERFFVLETDECGRFLFQFGNHSFAVKGVDFGLEEWLPFTPACVMATLLPFDGAIVVAGELAIMDAQFGPGLRSALEADLREARENGFIATTEVEFLELSSKVEEWSGLREIDALLGDLEDGLDAVGEDGDGVVLTHRGVLAGLSQEERQRRLEEHWHEELAKRDSGEVALDYFNRKICSSPVETDLVNLLMLATKDQIAEWGELCGAFGMTRLTKAKLAELVAEGIADADVLDKYLTWCHASEYELIELVVRNGGKIEVSEDDALDLVMRGVQAPFSYAFKSGDAYSIIVPDQIMQVLLGMSFARISPERAVIGSLHGLARACVELYGVISVEDLLGVYRSLHPDWEAVDEPTAAGVLNAMAGEYVFEPYRLVFSKGKAYLIEPDLLLDYLAGSEDCYDEDEQMAYRMAVSSFIADTRKMQEGIPRYVPDGVNLEEFELTEYMFSLPETLRLQAFLDEHVPGSDGSIDYSFADLTIENLIAMAVGGGGIQDALAYLEEAGMAFDLADVDELDEMIVLITDMMGSVPRWENNGWPPKEMDALREGDC